MSNVARIEPPKPTRPSDGLTVAGWAQLRSYADQREQDGWYYGNKAQFEARHEQIKAWLDKQILISSGRRK